MKIALCTSEAVPFAKTGGLADVCGALPVALEALGEEPIVVMPRYQSVYSSSIVLKRLNDDFDWTIIGNNTNNNTTYGIRINSVDCDKTNVTGNRNHSNGTDYSDNGTNTQATGNLNG